MQRDEQQEVDRARQQNQIYERHKRETGQRPNPVHRAIVFLLRETAANNRDTAKEAAYYVALLDREFSGEEQNEAEAQAAAEASAQVPEKPAEADSSIDTAALLKQSARFGGRKRSRTSKTPDSTEQNPDPDAKPIRQSSRFRR